MQAAHGVTGKRKFALTALLTFLLFAGSLATAQRARADSGSPAPNTAGEVATPPSQDPSTPQPATDQQSTTDQNANATATAEQPQQSNVVIIIRINSPGDDVVTQTNVVSVVAVGANQSSTTQNSGLPGPSATGTDPQTGSSDSPGADGQSADGQSADAQPAEGQAAPVPGAAPPRSQPAPAQTPVQAPSAVNQPVAQPAQAAPVAPQRPAAFAMLASSASSTANPEVQQSQGGLPTKSATHLRRGGVRGRSDASASRTPVEGQSGGFAGDPTSIGKAGSGATSTTVDPPNTQTIAARGVRGSVLDRALLAPPVQIAAHDPGSGKSLGLTGLLAALLIGLLGWEVTTWLPLRGPPWRGRGG
jgi:hypothetical protein